MPIFNRAGTFARLLLGSLNSHPYFQVLMACPKIWSIQPITALDFTSGTHDVKLIESTPYYVLHLNPSCFGLAV